MRVFRNLALWARRHLRLKTERDSVVPTAFDPSPIVEDKQLSPDERALLVWLIEHGTSDATEYAAQVEQARVVGRCRCGCPPIDLGIAGAKERTVGGSTILADFLGETPEGFHVGVLLHSRNGKLSELEVYSLDRDGIFSLPTIESLKPLEG